MFHYRVNGWHGTDRRTDGVQRVMRPLRGEPHSKPHEESLNLWHCVLFARKRRFFTVSTVLFICFQRVLSRVARSYQATVVSSKLCESKLQQEMLLLLLLLMMMTTMMQLVTSFVAGLAIRHRDSCSSLATDINCQKATIVMTSSKCKFAIKEPDTAVSKPSHNILHRRNYCWWCTAPNP